MQQRKKPTKPASPDKLFADVLARAIAEVRDRRAAVYTFAFYHDHESRAVSVCVDTKPNSARAAAAANVHRVRHFVEAVGEGDLEDASLHNAITGRNLSLGDFSLVNVARSDLQGVRPGKAFYLAMVRAVLAREAEIVSLAENADELLFCCSGAKDEVEYLWSVTTATA